MEGEVGLVREAEQGTCLFLSGYRANDTCRDSQHISARRCETGGPTERPSTRPRNLLRRRLLSGLQGSLLLASRLQGSFLAISSRFIASDPAAHRLLITRQPLPNPPSVFNRRPRQKTRQRQSHPTFSATRPHLLPIRTSRQSWSRRHNPREFLFCPPRESFLSFCFIRLILIPCRRVWSRELTKSLAFHLELPGIARDDVDLIVQGQMLSVSAQTNNVAYQWSKDVGGQVVVSPSVLNPD